MAIPNGSGEIGGCTPLGVALVVRESPASWDLRSMRYIRLSAVLLLLACGDDVPPGVVPLPMLDSEPSAVQEVHCLKGTSSCGEFFDAYGAGEGATGVGEGATDQTGRLADDVSQLGNTRTIDVMMT